MSRKSKFSTDKKLKYVLKCIEGKDSVRHTATLIGIDGTTLIQWIRNYQSLGIDSLKMFRGRFSKIYTYYTILNINMV